MLYVPTVEILKLSYEPWTNKGLTWQLPHHHTGSWPHPCRPTAVTSDLQLPGQPGEPGCLQTGSDRFWPIQICSLPSWFVGYCRNFPRFRLHLVFERKKLYYINWALSCRKTAGLVPGAWVPKFPELIIGCLIPSELGVQNIYRKRVCYIIICKHNVRWQHLSRMKDVSFGLIKLILSCEKTAGYYHPWPVAPFTTDAVP